MVFELTIQEGGLNVDGGDLVANAFSTIDSAEDGDVSEYKDFTNTLSAVQQFPAHGDWAIEFDGQQGSHTGFPSLSGLRRYPERGDTIKANARVVTRLNGFGIQFGLQEDRNAFARGYSVRVNHQNSGRLAIWYQDPSETFGGDELLGTKAINLKGHGSEHLELTVEWGSPSISATLEAEDGTHMGSLSVNESTWDSGGFGWTASTDSSLDANQFVYMDYARMK